MSESKLVPVLLAADEERVLVDDAFHPCAREVPRVLAVLGEAAHGSALHVALAAADAPAAQAGRADALQVALAGGVVGFGGPAGALVVHPGGAALVDLDQYELAEALISPAEEALGGGVDG